MRTIGVPSDSVIYVNPCKLASHLRFTRDRGVLRTTFDNEPELHKIAAQHPAAQLVLRIATDDSTSTGSASLSDESGAELRDVPGLIRKALELGLELVGVSFHVGEEYQDASTFVDALKRARWAFDQMEELRVTPWLLGIGGGFHSADASKVTFPEIAAVIRPVIDELFPPHVTVISEPGRYFCAGSHTLAAMIYERRERLIEDGSAVYDYYLTDGVYGSFNSVLWDRAVITDYTVIPTQGSRDTALRPLHKSTVFGPTCDGLDCILKDVTLPLIECGEWILFPHMGAYTHAASSSYFHQHTIHYVRM